MKILIIRHADPNYEIDSLTERGFKEANLLSDKLLNENITKIYTSPLGRAKDTAAPIAKKLGIEPKVLDWLAEIVDWKKSEESAFGTESDFNSKYPWNHFGELIS